MVGLPSAPFSKTRSEPWGMREVLTPISPPLRSWNQCFTTDVPDQSEPSHQRSTGRIPQTLLHNANVSSARCLAFDTCHQPIRMAGKMPP